MGWWHHDDGEIRTVPQRYRVMLVCRRAREYRYERDRVVPVGADRGTAHHANARRLMPARGRLREPACRRAGGAPHSCELRVPSSSACTCCGTCNHQKRVSGRLGRSEEAEIGRTPAWPRRVCHQKPAAAVPPVCDESFMHGAPLQPLPAVLSRKSNHLSTYTEVDCAEDSARWAPSACMRHHTALTHTPMPSARPATYGSAVRPCLSTTVGGFTSATRENAPPRIPKA